MDTHVGLVSVAETFLGSSVGREACSGKWPRWGASEWPWMPEADHRPPVGMKGSLPPSREMGPCGTPFPLLSKVPFLISAAATLLVSGRCRAFRDLLAPPWTNGLSLYAPQQSQGESRWPLIKAVEGLDREGRSRDDEEADSAAGT